MFLSNVLGNVDSYTGSREGTFQQTKGDSPTRPLLRVAPKAYKHDERLTPLFVSATCALRSHDGTARRAVTHTEALIMCFARQQPRPGVSFNEWSESPGRCRVRSAEGHKILRTVGSAFF